MKKRRNHIPLREFPVLVGVPVPSLDYKINADLSAFLEGLAARGIGLGYKPRSRMAECGRNSIIQDFLHNPQFKDYTHLLFLDADSYPLNPYAVELLLQHDKDVVAGVTPIGIEDNEGKLNVFWNVQTQEIQRNLAIHELPKTLFKATRIGGTCIMLKRKVLEKLSTPWQKSELDPMAIHFAKSEDYDFCDNIRASGFDIWVDPKIVNHHFHTLDYMKVLELVIRILGMNQKVA